MLSDSVNSMIPRLHEDGVKRRCSDNIGDKVR